MAVLMTPPLPLPLWHRKYETRGGGAKGQGVNRKRKCSPPTHPPPYLYLLVHPPTCTPPPKQYIQSISPHTLTYTYIITTTNNNNNSNTHVRE